MENEKRLIDAMQTVTKISGKVTPLIHTGASSVQVYNEILQVIAEAPTVDAVSRGVHDQVRWERDIAIEQLESYGISLGEKADVVKVVHGRWEKSPYFYGYVRCSVCHDCNVDDMWIDGKKWKYCPNCGAKMDGGADNG